MYSLTNKTYHNEEPPTPQPFPASLTTHHPIQPPSLLTTPALDLDLLPAPLPPQRQPAHPVHDPLPPARLLRHLARHRDVARRDVHDGVAREEVARPEQEGHALGG